MLLTQKNRALTPQPGPASATLERSRAMSQPSTHKTDSALEGPQHFPLYAVTKVGTVCIVLAWQDGAPLLLPLARNISTAPHRYTAEYQLYLVEQDAIYEALALIRNAAARQRRADAEERGELPDAMDSYWDKRSAPARAAVEKAAASGKPLTEAQWKKALNSGKQASA